MDFFYYIKFWKIPVKINFLKINIGRDLWSEEQFKKFEALRKKAQDSVLNYLVFEQVLQAFKNHKVHKDCFTN